MGETFHPTGETFEQREAEEVVCGAVAAEEGCPGVFINFFNFGYTGTFAYGSASVTKVFHFLFCVATYCYSLLK